jgi:hypothetical protein
VIIIKKLFKTYKKIIYLCQGLKKEKDIKCRPTKEKNDLERTVTRRKNNLP